MPACPSGSAGCGAPRSSGSRSPSHAALLKEAGVSAPDWVNKTLCVPVRYKERAEGGGTTEREKKDLQPLQTLFCSNKARTAVLAAK